MRLSVCMIVKNEEANLQRCLDSFLPILSIKDDDTLEPLAELIIVDTGSTDRTVNVAKKYTDSVFEKEFVPWSFSDARNYGIAKATGHWIMIVDADEELTQASLYILMDAVMNPAYEENNTIFIKLHNYYDKKQYAEVIQSRIFKNTGEPIYQFSIHNKPRVDTPYLFLDTVVFNHYGYMFQKQDLFLKKKERSLPMLEAEYDKNPDDLHILTHIVKTYYSCNDHENVVEKGERWIELMRGVDYHVGWFSYLEVFVNLVGSYTMLDDAKNAERVFEESKKYTDKLIALNLILGQYYLGKKNNTRARELFEEAYLMNQQPGDPYEMLCSTNTAVIMPEILNLLAIECFTDGDYTRAGKLINEGIAMNQNRLPLRWDIFNHGEARNRIIQPETRRKRSA